MYNSITHLSQFITPQTCGIIWFTDDDLGYNSPGVYELNYLLDGLLVKAIEENAQKKEVSNFFLGENFGVPFFVGHVVVKTKQDVDSIHNHFKLAESFIPDRATIYILNRSKNTANLNVQKVLTETYKHLEFKHLNI